MKRYCIGFDACDPVDVAGASSASYNLRFVLTERKACLPRYQSSSPATPPKRPTKIPNFCRALQARPLRILAEYIHPYVQLKKEGIGDTIVMFGSARILPRDLALARYNRLKFLPGPENPRRQSREAPRRRSPRQEFAGNVPLLRRSPSTLS